MMTNSITISTAFPSIYNFKRADMMTLNKFILTFFAALLLTGCATTGSVTTRTVPDEQSEYILGVGDNLRITVYGQEGLTGEYKIEPNGTVSFPLIKDVPASGYSAKELETAITQKLSPAYMVDPLVTVEVIAFRNMYVLGEVNQPGKYEYAPNMTVMQAVATAGGYTYRAAEDTAEVTRHVKGALKTFTVDSTTMLKPGDTIVVKRRWF